MSAKSGKAPSSGAPQPGRASSKSSWPSIASSATKLLAASTAALLSGPALPELLTSVQQQLKPSSKDRAEGSCQAALQLMQTLLYKLLSARKRPKDWKQAEYTIRVCRLLAVSRECLSAAPATAATAQQRQQCINKEFLSKVAAAMCEVSQLLAACSEQQQRSTPMTAQQQQLKQQFTALAVQLLRWRCLAVDHYLTVVTPHSAETLADATVGLDAAAELVVQTLQTLSNDSPAGNDAVVAEAAFRVCRCLMLAKHAQLWGSDAHEALTSYCSHAAAVRVCFALTLALAHATQRADSSSSSSSVCAGSTANSSSSDDGARSGCSSSSTSSGGCPDGTSSNTSSGSTGPLQLWQASGFVPAALEGFTAGVQQVLPPLSPVLLPQPLPYQGYKLSSPGSALQQQVFVLVLQWFSDMLACLVLQSLEQEPLFGQYQFYNPYEDAQTWETHSRQQQLLLQDVWAMPVMLLQTLQLAGPGDAALTDSLLTAVTMVCFSWDAPGLREPTSAAASSGLAATPAVAAGRRSTVQPLSQLLEPVLDTWLLLMQQLMVRLQRSTRMPQAAAGAAPPDASAMLALHSLTRLVHLLRRLPVIHAQAAWCNKSQAIVLVLDAVLRLLLQNYITPCGSSSGGNDSSSCTSGSGTTGSSSSSGSSNGGSGSKHNTLGSGESSAALELLRTLIGALNLLAGRSYYFSETDRGLAQPGVWHWGPLATSVFGKCRQQQCPDHNHDPQQQHMLLQQAFALSISQLKVGRSLQLERLFELDLCLSKGLWWCAEARANSLPPTASLAEVRVLLAPWVLLCGLHLRASRQVAAAVA